MAQQNPFATLNEALRWAVIAGDLDAMRAALQKGADANADIEGQSILCHVISQTNLMTAASKNDFIEILIAHRADINRAGPDGTTPLLAAVLGDDQAVLARILAAGANPDLTPEGKTSPLYLAVEGDLADTSDWRTRMLIAAGANPDAPVLALVSDGMPSVRARLAETAGEDARLTATGIAPRSDFARQAQHLLGCLGLPVDVRERQTRRDILQRKSTASAGRYKIGRGPGA